METPRDLGFYFPPEWDQHKATWLAWPYNKDTWFEKLEEAQKDYCRLIHTISLSEEVFILIPDEFNQQICERELTQLNTDLIQVHFVPVPTNDAWIRDFGPSFLLNKETSDTAIVNWDYNAWGDKYPPYNLDQNATYLINQTLNLQSFHPDMILEGGSFDVNGRGTLLTTESCLLNKNRNPHLSKIAIEKKLADYLSVDDFIWLESGMAGDDTDGHIDDITRFVNKDTVVSMYRDKRNDSDYEVLKNNIRTLQQVRLLSGKQLNVIEIPLSSRIYYKNDVLPASYANFYITNRHVIVPTFNDKHDELALETITKCFPNKQVVGLKSNNIVIGLGSFHCLTQQQPLKE